MFLVVLVFLFLMFAMVIQMRPFGDRNNTTNVYFKNRNFVGYKDKAPKLEVDPLIERKVIKEVETSGTSNMLTALLFNWRLFDSFLLISLIFGGLMCTIGVFRREKRTSVTRLEFSDIEPSRVLSTSMKFFIPVLTMIGVHVLLQGALGSGGGFQGGAIISASIIVFSLMFGLLSYMKSLPIAVKEIIEIAAVVMMLIIGYVSVFRGQNFMDFLVDGFSAQQQFLIKRILIILFEACTGICVGVLFSSIFVTVEKID